MTNRRAFLQTASGGLAAAQGSAQTTETDRQYWVRTMSKIAEPVLVNLAAGTLKRSMPVECVTGNVADRRKYSHLEAIGRSTRRICFVEPKYAGSGPDEQEALAQYFTNHFFELNFLGTILRHAEATATTTLTAP